MYKLIHILIHVPVATKPDQSVNLDLVEDPENIGAGNNEAIAK